MKRALIPLVVLLLLATPVQAIAEGESRVSRDGFTLMRVQNPPIAQFLGFRNSSGLRLTAPGVSVTVLQASYTLAIAITTERPVASVEGFSSDGSVLGKRIYYARDTFVLLPREAVTFSDDGVIYGPEGWSYVEEYAGDGVLEEVVDPVNGSIVSSERVFERYGLRGPWVIESRVDGVTARIKASSRSGVITLTAHLTRPYSGREEVPGFGVVVSREGTRRVEEVSLRDTESLITRGRAVDVLLNVTVPGRSPAGNLTLKSRLFFIRAMKLDLVRGFYRYTSWNGPPPLTTTVSEAGGTPLRGEGAVTLRDPLHTLGNFTPAGPYAIYSVVRPKRSIGGMYFYGIRWDVGMGKGRGGMWQVEVRLITSRVEGGEEESTPLVQQTSAGLQNTVSALFVLLIVALVALYLYVRGRRRRARKGPPGPQRGVHPPGGPYPAAPPVGPPGRFQPPPRR